MKKMMFVLMAAIFFQGCNSGGSPKNVKLKTEEDKILYVMGAMQGKSIQMLNMNEKEIQKLSKGYYDSATGKDLEVDPREYQAKIQGFLTDRMKNASKGNADKGVAYAEKFLKENKEAKKTESGLVYLVTQEGKGASPKETDTVEVHYHGTLIDGTVFDSSVERGKTATFPLNAVIKGWTEGLQTMKEGGKTKFIIPSDLAYGDTGAPPKIAPGSTLVFDVELVKIVKGDAAKKDAHAGHGHGDKKKKK